MENKWNKLKKEEIAAKGEYNVFFCKNELTEECWNYLLNEMNIITIDIDEIECIALNVDKANYKFWYKFPK